MEVTSLWDDIATDGITQNVVMERVWNGTAPHTVTSGEAASREMRSQLVALYGMHSVGDGTQMSTVQCRQEQVTSAAERAQRTLRSPSPQRHPPLPCPGSPALDTVFLEKVRSAHHFE